MTREDAEDEDLTREIGQRLVPELDASQITPADEVFTEGEAIRDDQLT